VAGAHAAEGRETRPAGREKSRKRAFIYLEIRDVCGEEPIFSMRWLTAPLTLPAADPECWSAGAGSAALRCQVA